MQPAVEEIGKYRPECLFLVKSFRGKGKGRRKKKKSMACNDCQDYHDCHGYREALVYSSTCSST